MNNTEENNKLDILADKFADSKDNNVFVEFMELLENSQVLVPAQLPEKVTDEIKRAAKTGESMPIDKQNQPRICLLAKNDGSKVFPIFTSRSQIPADKMTPAIMNIPFAVVISMVKSEDTEVSTIAVNPFTKGFVLNENLIDLVDRRYKNGANKEKAPGKTVQLTETQFHSIAHVQMSREKLPARIFADPEEVMSDLKLRKEAFVIDAYKQAYPSGARVPYTEDDCAVMVLQIDDDLCMTRIDLPEKYAQPGAPLRIYITQDRGETGYFIFERGGKDNPAMIGRVMPDGSYVKLEEAPSNGAEIEAVMNILKPS